VSTWHLLAVGTPAAPSFQRAPFGCCRLPLRPEWLEPGFSASAGLCRLPSAFAKICPASTSTSNGSASSALVTVSSSASSIFNLVKISWLSSRLSHQIEVVTLLIRSVGS
jgi:hypothetical protein